MQTAIVAENPLKFQLIRYVYAVKIDCKIELWPGLCHESCWGSLHTTLPKIICWSVDLGPSRL